ncbi:MAG TPA: lysophospholipid acyltransferase family protein [Thermoclostridium sp.]|nr:lysophospholipid acyltransferase family protein [Thermoclostridium sp.]
MLYSIGKVLFTIYFRLFYRIKVKGRENIPSEGPVLLCANHPTALDMFLIGVFVPKRKVHYMAKAELFRNRFLGWIIRCLGGFPVSRGTGDVGSVKTVFRLLEEGKIVGVFPEGTRTRKRDPNKRKAGIALFALHSGAPILPVAIKGVFRPFRKIELIFGKPYRIASDTGNGTGINYSKEELYRVSGEIIDSIYALME